MSGRACQRSGSREGSILILSLWVLFTLSALSIAVSSHVTALVRTADRAQRVERGNAAAAAGVALAQVMASERTNSWDGAVAGEWNTDPEWCTGVDLGGASVSLVFVTGADDEAVTNAGVVGCEGAINLNAAPVELLEAYFGEVGGMSPAVAAKVASGIVTEREQRLAPSEGEAAPEAGGEGPAFRSFYELGAIDGLDMETLVELAPGLTIHGSGMINLNAASYDVLRSLFVAVGGPTSRKTAERLADRLQRLHEAGHAFETPTFTDWWEVLRDFDSRASGDEQALLQRAASRSDIASTCFRGRALARLGSDSEEIVAVDFVIDTKQGSVVHWSTR